MDDAMPIQRIIVDHARFAAVRRPAMYAIANAVMVMQTEAGRAYDLRPLELQLYMLIGLSSIQRLVRMRPMPEGFMGDAPLPAPLRSGISRRQLAIVTGASRDAVARGVSLLIARGHVSERSRGVLEHREGMMERSKTIHHPDVILAPFVVMFEQLLRLRVLSISDTSA